MSLKFAFKNIKRVASSNVKRQIISYRDIIWYSLIRWRWSSDAGGGRTSITPSPFHTAYADACTWTYGAVHWRRTLHMLNYMLLTIVLKRATQLRCNGDGWQCNTTCTNQALFVRYVASIDVRRCSLCECCHRN